MSAFAWIAVGVGVAAPNFLFAYIRAGKRKTGNAERRESTLSESQRKAWEAVSLGAWLSPSIVVGALSLLGYGAVEILFGALAALAISLNLLLLGAVVASGVRKLRMKVHKQPR